MVVDEHRRSHSCITSLYPFSHTHMHSHILQPHDSPSSVYPHSERTLTGSPIQTQRDQKCIFSHMYSYCILEGTQVSGVGHHRCMQVSMGRGGPVWDGRSSLLQSSGWGDVSAYNQGERAGVLSGPSRSRAWISLICIVRLSAPLLRVNSLLDYSHVWVAPGLDAAHSLLPSFSHTFLHLLCSPG